MKRVRLLSVLGFGVFSGIFLFLPTAEALSLNGNWVLDGGTVSYHGNWMVKSWDGVSKEVKGKGSCDQTGCEFLVAAPVQSFDSDNSNRDAHMLEEVKGAIHKMVIVHIDHVALSEKGDAVTADLEIELGGKKVRFPKAPFTLKPADSNLYRLTGKIPATLSQFQIDPPSLMGVSMSEEIPVTVDVVWRREK